MQNLFLLQSPRNDWAKVFVAIFRAADKSARNHAVAVYYNVRRIAGYSAKKRHIITIIARRFGRLLGLGIAHRLLRSKNKEMQKLKKKTVRRSKIAHKICQKQLAIRLIGGLQVQQYLTNLRY
jgi:hypothetical protein